MYQSFVFSFLLFLATALIGPKTQILAFAQEADPVNVEQKAENKPEATTETSVDTKENKISEDKKEKSKKPKEVFYKCTKGKEMRWMRISYLKNGKCKTTYSKVGNAQQVAQAQNYSSCEGILNGIRKNLEAGGFKCEEKTLMGALDLE